MSVIYVIDILGTFAFAVSGALVALDKKFDMFGVLIIAFVTAVGGGMLRDIVINREPLTFRGVIYEEVAILGGVIVLIGLFFANKFEHTQELVWLIVTGSILIVFITMWLINQKGLRYSMKRISKK